MNMCYNHVFIYAEFEIIHMFFKERRNVFYMFHAYTESSVWSWKLGLKSWKSPVDPSVPMCQNPADCPGR